MSIEKFSGSNMVGIQAVYYAFKSEIKNIGTPDDELHVDVTMQPNADWKQLYFTIESGQFQVKHRSDASGNYYQIEVGLKLPKVRGAAGHYLESLQNRDLVLLVTDNNRSDWLVGTLEQPARIKFDSQLSWGSTNAFDVVFSIEASDTHPFLLDSTVTGGAFSDGFSSGFAI